MRPSVTVVITTHKREELLRRSISSVLAQTYRDFELLIIDDDPSGSAAKELLRFDDARIRYVLNSKNLGISGCRKAAIAVVRTPYIAFLDDDDEWLPGKLGKQIEHLSNHDHSNGLVSYTRVIYDDGYSRRSLPKAALGEGQRIDEYLFTQNGLILPSSLVIDQTAARIWASTPSLNIHDEFSFYLQAAMLGVRFLFLAEELTIWHADYGRARITSAGSGFLNSQLWLQTYQSQMSAESVDGFRMSQLLPRAVTNGELGASFAIWLACLTRRSLPLKSHMMFSLRGFTPDRLKIALKKFARIFNRLIFWAT